MSLSEEELKFFLETHVQEVLERCEYLHTLFSPEERPYDNKYAGRKLLEELLKDPKLEGNNDSELVKPLIAIIYHMLSVNYTETEENSQGEHLLKESLKQFTSLKGETVKNFFIYLIEGFNNLGFFHVNRDDNELGISILLKAERLYQLISKHPNQFNFAVNNTREFISDKNRPQGAPISGAFRYYYQGGINRSKLEKLHTLTLFYLAQSFTKLNLKDKAATYCAATMTRQYASKDYEIKDWCLNCVSLAEFYYNNKYFCQAQYLLQCGLALLPEGKKKKLRATFHLSFGRMFMEFFKTAVTLVKTDNQNSEEIQERVD